MSEESADLYILRDLRGDGSAHLANRCDMEFLVKAVRERAQLPNGDTASELNFTPNRVWHSANEIRTCASSFSTYGSLGSANFDWVVRTASGFPTPKVPSWSAALPPYWGDGIKACLSSLCNSTADFFVVRDGVANTEITDADTGAAWRNPVRENHVRALYYDINGRGTKAAWGNAFNFISPVVSHSVGSGTTSTIYEEWGDRRDYQPSFSPTSSDPFSFSFQVSANRYVETYGEGERDEWFVGQKSWSVFDNETECGIAEAFSGKVAALQFLSVFRVERSLPESGAAYTEVPHLWTAAEVDGFSPPWRLDAQNFAQMILSQVGGTNNYRQLASGLGENEAASYEVSHAGTFTLATLTLETNIDEMGWNGAFTPTSSS